MPCTAPDECSKYTSREGCGVGGGGGGGGGVVEQSSNSESPLQKNNKFHLLLGNSTPVPGTGVATFFFRQLYPQEWTLHPVHTSRAAARARGRVSFLGYYSSNQNVDK